jgi:hypothetical protein
MAKNGWPSGLVDLGDAWVVQAAEDLHLLGEALE